MHDQNAIFGGGGFALYILLAFAAMLGVQAKQKKRKQQAGQLNLPQVSSTKVLVCTHACVNGQAN